MCGISGYFITKPDRIRPQAIQQLAANLLRHIESRGKDATGYAYVSRKDTKATFVCKAPVAASDFLRIDGHLLTKKSISAMPRSMLLHTRYATQGSPTDNRNNHPVYSKDSGLCLIHNGWFVDDESTIKQFELHKDAEVDTETYLRLIEKFYLQGEIKTVESGIQQATRNVWGSIACAMVQGGKPGVMWLWRDQGQLALALTDWGYVFASTQAAVVESLLESCMSIDLSWYEILPVPRQTLLRFHDTDSEPKIFDLEGPEWEAAPKHIGNAVTRSYINGESVVRRNRSGTAYNNYIWDGYEGDYSDWETNYYGSRGQAIPLDDKSSSSGDTRTQQPGLSGLAGGRTNPPDGSPPADANSNSQEARAEGHQKGCYCDACFQIRREAHAAGKPCNWQYCATCNSGFLDA